MSQSLPSRRWFQFGLRSLILVIVVCALGLTWWRQWRMTKELESREIRITLLEHESEFNSKLRDAYRILNLDEAKHREAFNRLKKMGSGIFGATSETHRLSVDGERYDLVMLRNDSMSVPGWQSTVALLIQDDKLVDVVSRDSSTRTPHKVHVEDANGDGDLDLVFRCSPWLLNNESEKLFIYRITGRGFVEAGK